MRGFDDLMWNLPSMSVTTERSGFSATLTEAPMAGSPSSSNTVPEMPDEATAVADCGSGLAEAITHGVADSNVAAVSSLVNRCKDEDLMV